MENQNSFRALSFFSKVYPSLLHYCTALTCLPWIVSLIKRSADPAMWPLCLSHPHIHVCPCRWPTWRMWTCQKKIKSKLWWISPRMIPGSKSLMRYFIKPSFIHISHWLFTCLFHFISVAPCSENKVLWKQSCFCSFYLLLAFFHALKLDSLPVSFTSTLT